jgi:hypothetical protein
MSRGEAVLGHFSGEMGAPFGAWIAKEKPRIWREKGSAARRWGGGFSRLDSRYGLSKNGSKKKC